MAHKLLIIGDGFVGTNLFNYYRHKHHAEITNRDMLDVCKKKSIQKYFKNASDYTHVIYAAGLKDIKYCEENPQEAFDINAEAVRNLVPHIGNAQFIYISTDYVFNGIEGNYNEASLPQPRTIYGKSKLVGEWYCDIYASNPMIVRTSGIYGPDCGWLDWLRSEISEDKEIVCYADVHNSPTYVDNLAEMIMDMIECGFYGCINLSGPERLNRYELYKKVFKYYNGDTTRLLSGSAKGTMPYDVSLNNTLHYELTNRVSWTVEQGLKDMSPKELA